jgi:hypothetical protein
MPSQEDISNQYEQLVEHRRNLQILLVQESKYGALTPSYIQVEIQDRRTAIQKLKAALRNWGQSVEDLPNDEAFSAARELGGALQNVADLMQAPAVRQSLDQFHDSLELLNAQIQALQTYKDFHDQLHLLQFGCYRPIMVGAREFPQNQTFTESLHLYAIELQQVIDELWGIADRLHVPPTERRWIEQLEQAHEQVEQALQTLTREPFERALYQIERVLNLQPTRINERLKAIARGLPFDQLLEALRSAKAWLASEENSEDSAQAIDRGIAAVEHVRERLNQLIDEHDIWQRFDPDLRQYEHNPAQYAQQFTWLWQSDLKPSLADLYLRRDDRWTRELRRVGERLDQALTAQTAPTLVEASRAFYSCFGKCFFQADKELKDQCSQLRMIDGPLKSVIGMFA